MYRPNASNFKIHELMPPQELSRFGEELCWSFLSPMLLVTLQTIRNRHGGLLINSPARGMVQRGFRGEAFVSQTAGSNTSAKRLNFIRSGSTHKRGAAIDATPLETTLAKIHQDIKDRPDLYPFLSFVEVDVSWLHVDVRNADNITFWSPKRGVVDVIKRDEYDWSKHVFNKED